MTDSKTPQQQGRDWEIKFAKDIGATPVRNSGAGFSKLDVRGLSILWSLKLTTFDSIIFLNAWMREALAAINGPGGIGGSMIPAVAMNIGGEEYMVFRKADALLLFSEDAPNVATPVAYKGKDLGKRIPRLLQEED